MTGWSCGTCPATATSAPSRARSGSTSPRTPNPHVSFGGGGPHYCLGANLAKKEVQVLMAATLDRFDVEITGEPKWIGVGAATNVGVGLDHLPVRLTPR